MKLIRELMTERFDDEYAFVPKADRECSFNGILWVNEDGKAILDHLKEDITREELILALAEETDAPPEEVAAEVDGFLTRLEELKLLA